MQRKAEQLRCKVAAREWQHFPRSKFIGLLHEQLVKEPVGPVVLTGPEGAGTSGIAEAGMANSGSPLLLHVNLRERAASGDRTLFWQLVRSSGYYVMNREMADIGLGRFTGIDAYDIEACMTAYAEVCQHEHEARDAGPSWWRRLLWGETAPEARPLPVLCIDEMQAIRRESDTTAREAELLKLMRWTLYLTENRLAHVLLVCHTAASLELDERYAPFRARRQRIIVGFPPATTVRRYLTSAAGGALADHDAMLVARAVGGHFKDLKLVVDAVKRARLGGGGGGGGSSSGDGSSNGGGFGGGGFGGGGGGSGGGREAVEQLLADSKEKVVRTWELMIDEGNSPALGRSARIAAYKRGLRFWAMAEALSRGPMLRVELAATVFGATGGSSAEEIEEYLSLGLLTYAGEAAVADAPDSSDAADADAQNNNRVWVCAASPRLQAGFASLTSDPLCVAFKSKASGELARHEMLMRGEQLAARRGEQAADATALGRLLGSESLEGAPRAGVEHALERLVDEWQHTTAELQQVRNEYDRAKWKGRWAAPPDLDRKGS